MKKHAIIGLTLTDVKNLESMVKAGAVYRHCNELLSFMLTH